jgi:alpha-D-xyloside xylohydrolase
MTYRNFRLALGIGASLLLIPASIAAEANQPPGLLSAPLDISGDFQDLANTFFLADSLATFDPATAVGAISWRRNQLAPRIAFDNMEAALHVYGGDTFPAREYAVDPKLPFSIQFVSPRTVRIRIKTSDTARPEMASLMLVGEPPRDTSWKYSAVEGGHRYTSSAGSVTILTNPWHIEFRDAQGKLLTRTHHTADNRPMLDPVRGRGLLAQSGREAVRLRRILYAARQAWAEDGALDQRRQWRGKRPHVQAHSVLHEQPRIWNVRAHLGPGHVRFRRIL